MKKVCILLWLCCSSPAVFTQVNSNQWTWMQGDNFIPQHPIYGTKGIAAASNKLGARSSAVSWTEASGRLWVFGGKGYTNSSVTDLNDLWMYEPALGQWTWMSGDSSSTPAGRYGAKGIPAPTSKPGGRSSAVSWTDASGNLWLFGGNDQTFNYLNDLWRYTPSTGQWTWMGGDNIPNQIGTYGSRGITTSTNKPGARSGAVSWTDTSGNLWLFGGYGLSNYFLGPLNDLWRYTTSNGQWTWMSGDSTDEHIGEYGIQGVSASTNKPGTRHDAVGWTDASGSLWLYGGTGRARHSTGNLNDLWKYAPSTGQWTWMSGDSTTEQKTVYGTKGIAATANKPGARYGTFSWADASGNLWLFGGIGYASIQFGYLNDLWKYAPSTGQWTWVGGDSTYGRMAVYGTRGIASAANDPGQRYDAVGGVDASGNVWLVSGGGYAPGNNYNSYPNLNDLWKYVPSTGLWTWISGDQAYSHVGIYGTKSLPSPANKPGPREGAISWTDASDNLWMFGGSESTLKYLNDLWKYAPSTGQWAWMSGDSTANQTDVLGTKGVAAPANKPGAGSVAVSWKSKSGGLWLFSGSYLWKYEPLTGQWTWISGDTITGKAGVYGTRGVAAPANKPGARAAAVSWTDALDNLWLFSGSGYSSNGVGYLNDLWKYTPSTGHWTWMSGDSTREQAGVYGIKGTAAPANKPGARSSAVSWTDASGNLWLFGGYGYATTFGYNLNDLWKYTPSTGQWTWISGDSIGVQVGVYGIKGIAAPANKPGARLGAVSWTATSGDLLLLGGHGYASGKNSGFSEYLNDLWKYSPSTGQWTWMSGDSTLNPSGVYGAKGITAPANKPGGRSTPVSWIDTSANLWLFGGMGYSSSYSDLLNDLWKYSAPAGSLPVQFSSFSARKQLQQVLLSWTTAQEQNSCCFIIEHSSTGAVYDSIGMVAASGTTSTSANYSFTDKTPLQGDNFYRLKQLDLDGRFMYSKIVKVHTGEDAVRFAVMQNPVQNILQLQVQLPAAQKLTLQVRDISGHLLVSEDRMGSKGSSVYSLLTDHLARGTYLINMQTENMNITKRFIKQ